MQDAVARGVRHGEMKGEARAREAVDIVQRLFRLFYELPEIGNVAVRRVPRGELGGEALDRMLRDEDFLDVDLRQLELHGERLGEELGIPRADARAAADAGTDLHDP